MPTVGFLALHEPRGKMLTIPLVETEEDLRRGDETLNRATASGGGEGRRVSVEVCEVGLRVAAQSPPATV